MRPKFDPNKLAEAKPEFDPAKLKEAAPDNPGEAGAPEAGSFSSDYMLPLKYARDYALKEAPNVGAAILASKAPVPVLKGLAGPLLMPVIKGAYQAVAGSGTEWLKQHLGITPPDEKEILMAGAVPAVAETGAQAVKLGRTLGGRPGAVALNEIGPAEARQTAAKYTPRVQSSTLFDQASQEGARIPMLQTGGAMGDLNRQIGSLSSGARAQKSTVSSYIRGLQDKIAQNGGHLSPSELNSELSALGEIIGGMGRQGAPGLGEAKRLYASMIDDLDRAADNEVRQTMSRPGTVEPVSPSLPAPTSDTTEALTAGAAHLRQARNVYRKEKGLETYNNAVEKATRINRGQGGDEQFNASQVIAELKKDRFFSKSFKPEEQKDMFDTLEVLNQIPPLPTPRGVNAGSMKMLQRLTQAGAAAGGANAMGHGPVITALAGATGFLAKDAADLVRNISIASKTGPGRALIREMAKDKGGFWSPRTASVIGAYVNALQAYPDAELAK